MSRKVGVLLLLTVILGIFAYSTFINVQREENLRAARSVGD